MLTTRYVDEIERLRQVRDTQLQWIEDRGGTLQAYIDRYGSVDDPLHIGDGGEAIFVADMQALIRAMHALNLAERRLDGQAKRAG